MSTHPLPFSLFLFFFIFYFFPRILGGCLAFAGLREHRVPIASEKGFGWPRQTPERPQNLWKHHQRLQVGYICSLEVILLFCYLPWPEEPLTWGMLYKRSVQFAANYRVSLPDQSGRPQQSWHPLTSLVWPYSHWEPDDSSKVCACACACACATRVILGQSQQLQKYCLSFLDEAGPLEGFCVVTHRNVSLYFLTSLYHWVYCYYCGCLRF